MRVPQWLRAELETLGSQVLGGDITRDDAARLIADQILSRDPGLARQILANFGGKQLREWVKSQLNDYYAAGEGGGEPGDQLELFVGLPRLLETSPGRFAHISSMTGPDWDSALRQAEVKAGNAGDYAKSIRRAYEQVRPLLSDDDSLTTADVADRLTGSD